MIKRILIVLALIMVFLVAFYAFDVARVSMDAPDIGTDILEEQPAKEGTLIFDENITFSWEYIAEEEQMPYALFTPSSAESGESVPLIVWLHGIGERNVGESTFLDSGLLKVMKDWSSEGFHAYVLCPQLAGSAGTGDWTNSTATEHIKLLIDEFISERNIDAERIIIVGHSLGGRGSIYMACELSEYFSKLVVLSGYEPGTDVSQIEIPVRGYVGSGSCGEDTGSIAYMSSVFSGQFGLKNLHSLDTSHGRLPEAAFTEDRDGDNRSDLIHWMLTA